MHLGIHTCVCTYTVLLVMKTSAASFDNFLVVKRQLLYLETFMLLSFSYNKSTLPVEESLF